MTMIPNTMSITLQRWFQALEYAHVAQFMSSTFIERPSMIELIKAVAGWVILRKFLRRITKTKEPTTTTTTTTASMYWDIVLYGFIIGDILHYLAHRLMHRRLILQHRVHHGPNPNEVLNAWIASRVHPIESLINAFVVFGPIALFGKSDGAGLEIFAIIQGLNATRLHDSRFPSKLFTVFEDHLFHHESNLSRRYGNLLTIWDKIFGTF